MGRLTRWLHMIRSHRGRAGVVGVVLPGVLLLTLALWGWGPILSAPVALVAQAAVSEGSAVTGSPDQKPTPKPRHHSSPTLDPTPTDIPSPPALPTISAPTVMPTTMPTTLPTATASSTASSGARAGETAGSGNGNAPATGALLLASLGWGLGAMVVGMLGFSLVVFATRPEKGKRTWWGRQRENGPKKGIRTEGTGRWNDHAEATGSDKQSASDGKNNSRQARPPQA
jgi:hypothetical protein